MPQQQTVDYKYGGYILRHPGGSIWLGEHWPTFLVLRARASWEDQMLTPEEAEALDKALQEKPSSQHTEIWVSLLMGMMPFHAARDAADRLCI